MQVAKTEFTVTVLYLRESLNLIDYLNFAEFDLPPLGVACFNLSCQDFLHLYSEAFLLFFRVLVSGSPSEETNEFTLTL